MEFVETSTKLKLTMSNMILTEFRQLNNLCLFRNCPITNQDRLILALASTWLGTIRSIVGIPHLFLSLHGLVRVIYYLASYPHTKKLLKP